MNDDDFDFFIGVIVILTVILIALMVFDIATREDEPPCLRWETVTEEGGISVQPGMRIGNGPVGVDFSGNPGASIGNGMVVSSSSDRTREVCVEREAEAAED